MWKQGLGLVLRQPRLQLLALVPAQTGQLAAHDPQWLLSGISPISGTETEGHTGGMRVLLLPGRWKNLTVEPQETGGFRLPRDC